MRLIIACTLFSISACAFAQNLEPLSEVSLSVIESTTAPADSIEISLSMVLPDEIRLMGFVMINETMQHIVNEDIIDVNRDADLASTEFILNGNSLTLLLGSFPADETFSIEVYSMDHSGNQSSSQIVSTTDQP